MTETSFTWRWLIVVGAVGIIVGVVIGLVIGWVIAPTAGGPVDVSALSASEQNNYIITVANAYAYDQDLTRARARLALLKDPNIAARVETLAKGLETRKDPNAAAVADLAVALGSKESALRVLAATIIVKPHGEPTKFAVVEILQTATLKATDAATATALPTNTPTNTATPVNTKVSATAGPTRTPRPAATAQPTNPPVAAAALYPEFHPDYPGLWWDAVKFVPASVSSGQQYWHLKFAKYCDWSPNEGDNTCPGWPGGIMDHSIYIMTVNSSGNCVNTNVTDILNDGTNFPLTPDILKMIPYAWNPFGYSCNFDYEKAMYGEGNDISVPGLPSDKITSLCLCNKTPVNGQSILQGHSHVRYFLIFQHTTR